MEILNYINGEWVKPEVTECFDVINPATGQVIAKTPLSGKEVVDAAAKAASEAFPAWRQDARSGPGAVSLQAAGSFAIQRG